MHTQCHPGRLAASVLTTSRHDSSTNSSMANMPRNTSSATSIPIQSHHLVVSLKQRNPKSTNEAAQHASFPSIPVADPQPSMTTDSVFVVEGRWRKMYSSGLVQGVHVTTSQILFHLPLFKLLPNYWHTVSTFACWKNCYVLTDQRRASPIYF